MQSTSVTPAQLYTCSIAFFSIALSFGHRCHCDLQTEHRTSLLVLHERHSLQDAELDRCAPQSPPGLTPVACLEYVDVSCDCHMQVLQGWVCAFTCLHWQCSKRDGCPVFWRQLPWQHQSDVRTWHTKLVSSCAGMHAHHALDRQSLPCPGGW